MLYLNNKVKADIPFISCKINFQAIFLTHLMCSYFALVFLTIVSEQHFGMKVWYLPVDKIAE